jgi:uncharacterized repeat protein (TIGR01451 family)
VLYAYNNGTGELFRIELDLTNQTGTANPPGPFATGDVAGFNDGTSCPYTLAMQKSVNPESAQAGQIVTYTYRIFNQNVSSINTIDFEDILPADGRIFVAGTLNNPFGGAVNAFGGTNTLQITGITVSGDSAAEITVDVLIPATATAGTVTNQAFLRNVPVGFGGPNIPSDFPPTAEPDDETPLEILPSPTRSPEVVPKILIVKRLTAINGVAISGFEEVASDPSDNDAGWPGGPQSFLQGAVQKAIRPGDEVEFSIYFLLNGQPTPEQIVFCDPLPPGVSYRSNLSVQINGSRQSLTDAVGDDAGSFVSIKDQIPRDCEDIPGQNGFVVVDLGALSKTQSAAGAVRFTVEVSN